MKENKRIIDITVDEMIASIMQALDKKRPVEPPRFITEEEARKLLNCGKTHLYSLRVQGKISYVQDTDHSKLLLYQRSSILSYLESNLKKAF